MMEFLEM